MTDKYSYLFLDRDGVINVRLPGEYVQNIETFQFTDGALEAIALLSKQFERILIVTNQQGIGKGIMTEQELEIVHDYMQAEIEKTGGRVDRIYFCPDLAGAESTCRKPNPRMAYQAKEDFPEIDFTKSIIIGDSVSDMLFGKRLGMKTIMIKSNPDQVAKASRLFTDEFCDSLADFSNSLTP